ncbi:MAG: hypothetical protein QME81_20110 [bacterium]|nr:hypothetical protein [bacterium]
MSENKKDSVKQVIISWEGYQPRLKKGQQPVSGNLDASKPPRGGTGVIQGTQVKETVKK